MFKKKFPFYHQLDSQDCGPSCLRMIAMHYGKQVSLETIKNRMHYSKTGVSLLSINDAAETLGFETNACEVNFNDIKEVPLPAILHWHNEHFVVLYGIRKNRLLVADPSFGRLQFTEAEFKNAWCASVNEPVGIMLLLNPTEAFEKLVDEKKEVPKNGIRLVLPYLRHFKGLIANFFAGLVLSTIILYAIPILTKGIVDVGISFHDSSFVYLLLAGQLALYVGNTFIELIRRWIVMFLSAKISVLIVSDFLVKIMKLPIKFFETKIVGDVLQRVDDHQRIDNFLTGSSLNFLFSIVLFISFLTMLFFNSVNLAIVFLIFSAFYLAYSLLFLRHRARLDFKKFVEMANNRSNLIEIVQGMAEIKLSGSEKVRRKEWEATQLNLFKISIASNKLLQYQSTGSALINDLKNILITALAATAVINGELSIGGMLAAQFIVGQLNVPLNDFINFIRSYQDAQISLNRIGEVHEQKDETELDAGKLTSLPQRADISIRNLSFKYESNNVTTVLDNINLDIPFGKTTAIVGTSGSGKTTLMKLLLKFYTISDSEIAVANHPLNQIDSATWRANCGVVMQDGFIFSDTIARNISMSVEQPRESDLWAILQMVNLKTFVEDLPLGLNTKIGSVGIGLSAGQRQRLLIARAVYKNPPYIFFDEATSALDARNEKLITENMADIFSGRTVVVIAHRLSTIKKAQKIIVLHEGKVEEEGTHEELISKQGQYYSLVKNQME